MLKRIYKDQQFKVRLTKQQLVAIKGAAKREGLTPTAWAVRCMMAKCLLLTEEEECRLRGIIVESQASPRASFGRGGECTQKNCRRAVRTADGRTSGNMTDAAPDAAKGRAA